MADLDVISPLSLSEVHITRIQGAANQKAYLARVGVPRCGGGLRSQGGHLWWAAA